MPTCQEAGIIGSLTGTLGAIQATEALKLILGVGEPLVGRLWTYDSRTAIVRILEYQPDPACPLIKTGDVGFKISRICLFSRDLFKPARNLSHCLRPS